MDFRVFLRFFSGFLSRNDRGKVFVVDKFSKVKELEIDYFEVGGRRYVTRGYATLSCSSHR